MTVSLWNITTGSQISLLIERTPVEILLPVANNYTGIELELISGSLPTGTRLDGIKIVGTAFEVVTDTVFTAVIRAHWMGNFDDRTLKIVVTGADAPVWITNPGLLPIGSNETLFILDNEIIDYQLLANDPDIPAGDVLDYYIANDDGVLPPGITLSRTGKLQGITEPLLALDQRYQDGGYDAQPYGEIPFDYADAQSIYYNSQSLKKLNRYYPFAVTVTDGDTFVRREFKIYLVGDDYLRADNTIMSVSTGVFRADNTHIRTPKWITPTDLGFRRANNYQTLFLEIIDNETLSGAVYYTLENLNDDGSISELPKGMTLDRNTGEVYGRIPYQPAITENYKFTVNATRDTGDLDTLSIYATFYEDVLLGKTSFKVYKIDLTGTLDGINDLYELSGRDILINNGIYKVILVDDSNADYDVIHIDSTLAPKISLILSRTADVGDEEIFVNRLSENEKEKYQSSKLNFTDTESYTISEIIPYIEYQIEQPLSTSDPILPQGSPISLTVYQQIDPNVYVIYTEEVGGNDKIYKYVGDSFTIIQPQLDIENTPIEVNGVIQIDVDINSSDWEEIAESLESVPLDDRVTATIQALEAEFGGNAYVEVIATNLWKIRLRSTSDSRIITNIKDFFANSASASPVVVTLLRDNEDRIKFANSATLLRQLEQGRNTGIALFKNDFFYEDILISSTDIVDLPSSVKTFEVNVIGEIDTNIEWLTDSYLGSINANYTSTLKVEAQTTVPDTRMLYRLVDGKLPYGMSLTYSGEIVGAANQFADDTTLGLTTFDNKTVAWDGNNPGETTFDRQYRFTIEAKDRFNYTAIEREFVLDVIDLDNTQYTDIVARPMLVPEQRDLYKNFVINSNIFPHDYIYRPDDPEFGIQQQIEMLIYAGIEAKSIDKFVSAAAKNHKRKKYILGDFKKAIARQPGTTDTVYEVIYIDVIDPANAKIGKTRNNFNISTTNKITVDSIQYAAKDDFTKLGLGGTELPIYGRQTVRFLFPDGGKLLMETRNSDIFFDIDNNDFTVDVRNDGVVTVELALSDSEPQRHRPTTNTIKTDSDAVKVSDAKDQKRYISSINNMRDNIKQVGNREREYLPLWMRTPQAGYQELDFVSAIPVCYCKPGTADGILLNIKNSNFDVKSINFEIDRYIVKRSEGTNQEQYILFANYQFNV